jgi:hypothetical protein
MMEGSAQVAVETAAPVVAAPVELTKQAGRIEDGPGGQNANQLKAAFDKTRSAKAMATFEKLLGNNAEAPAGETTPRETQTEEPAEEPKEETTVEAAPEEPTEEPKKEPATEEESRLDRIMKATAKAKAQASRDRQLRAQMADLQRQREADRANMAQMQAERDRLASIESSLKDNPLEAFRKAGLTPEQLLQQALKEGTPEAKMEAMMKTLEAERAEREKLQRTIAEREQAAQAQRVQDDYFRASQNAEKYPNLVGKDKAMLVAFGSQVAIMAAERYRRETGTTPDISDRQILRYLNDWFSPKAAPEQAASPAKTPTPAKKAPPVAGNRKTQDKPEPRTLTNSQTAASFNRPSNWENLSRDQRAAALKASFGRR